MSFASGSNPIRCFKLSEKVPPPTELAPGVRDAVPIVFLVEPIGIFNLKADENVCIVLTAQDGTGHTGAALSSNINNRDGDALNGYATFDYLTINGAGTYNLEVKVMCTGGSRSVPSSDAIKYSISVSAAAHAREKPDEQRARFLLSEYENIGTKVPEEQIERWVAEYGTH